MGKGILCTLERLERCKAVSPVWCKVDSSVRYAAVEVVLRDDHLARCYIVRAATVVPDPALGTVSHVATVAVHGTGNGGSPSSKLDTGQA